MKEEFSIRPIVLHRFFLQTVGLLLTKVIPSGELEDTVDHIIENISANSDGLTEDEDHFLDSVKDILLSQSSL